MVLPTIIVTLLTLFSLILGSPNFTDEQKLEARSQVITIIEQTMATQGAGSPVVEQEPVVVEKQPEVIIEKEIVYVPQYIPQVEVKKTIPVITDNVWRNSDVNVPGILRFNEPVTVKVFLFSTESMPECVGGFDGLRIKLMNGEFTDKMIVYIDNNLSKDHYVEYKGLGLTAGLHYDVGIEATSASGGVFKEWYPIYFLYTSLDN
jgi:hypothetical protein